MNVLQNCSATRSQNTSECALQCPEMFVTVRSKVTINMRQFKISLKMPTWSSLYEFNIVWSLNWKRQAVFTQSNMYLLD